MQERLFSDDSAPYQSHSVTSKDAAESIIPKAGTLRKRVLDYLTAFGPATDEEIQLALGMNANTERPRRVELVTAGLVRDSGRTRRTSAGREAVLWAFSERTND